MLDVAKETRVQEKIASMLNGEVVNTTEKRQVQHYLLRCQDTDSDIKREVI